MLKETLPVYSFRGRNVRNRTYLNAGTDRWEAPRKKEAMAFAQESLQIFSDSLHRQSGSLPRCAHGTNDHCCKMNRGDVNEKPQTAELRRSRLQSASLGEKNGLDKRRLSQIDRVPIGDL